MIAETNFINGIAHASKRTKKILVNMVEILLATYNSEKFISEQLESIVNQDYMDWTLLIRDGGSNDSTIAIIEKFQAQYPQKTKIISSTGRAGYIENFSHLLTASTADIVMFCDHDDIWLPNKISRTVSKLLDMETTYSKDTPILVHCESKIIDDNSCVVAENLRKYWHFESLPKHNSMLVEIPVFGCSMAINKALIELASPIPLDGGSHDMWIGRVAWYLGKVGYIKEPLLLYRVHGSNASSASLCSFPLTLFRWLPKLQIIRKRIYDFFVHPTKIFIQRYKDQIPEQDLDRLTAFSKFNEYNFFKKRYLILRYKIHGNGWFRTFGMFIII